MLTSSFKSCSFFNSPFIKSIAKESIPAIISSALLPAVFIIFNKISTNLFDIDSALLSKDVNNLFNIDIILLNIDSACSSKSAKNLSNILIKVCEIIGPFSDNKDITLSIIVLIDSNILGRSVFKSLNNVCSPANNAVDITCANAFKLSEAA